MAARATSSATISFGLVSIPVKLYSTADSSTGIRFNNLHDKCGSRLKQQYICPQDDNEVVPRENMVKGYEFSKGQYVTFTADELKTLESVATKSIDIEEFVPVDKIDPVYFDKSYYLGPDKGGEKPYRLLAEVMRQTGRSALARYSARGKQYIVLVVPYHEGLMLQQLRYADEIKAFADVDIGEGEIKPAELKLATQIVEQISVDEFHPEQFEDEVKRSTNELVKQKIEGEEITAAPADAPQAQIIDLMDALKQSLASQGGGTARKPPKQAKEKKAAAKPKKKRASKK